MSDEKPEDSTTNGPFGIDIPQFSATSLAVAANLNFPTPTQDLAKALANTPALNSTALKVLADENLASMMGAHALSDLSTTLAAFDEVEAITTYSEVAAIASMPTATMQPMLNTLAAFDDLPNKVFSTGLTASTVSSRAGTASSPTPSPSSPEPSTEAGTPPTLNHIDTEVSDSLYVNNALAIGSLVACQIEGLDQEQIERAAVFIAICIVAGTGIEYPVVRHALVSGSAAVGLGSFMMGRRNSD